MASRDGVGVDALEPLGIEVPETTVEKSSPDGRRGTDRPPTGTALSRFPSNERTCTTITWAESQAETTVTVDGRELSVAYRDEGDGVPVVFLRGIPTWSFLWRRIAPPLADRFRTIVPDLVGYGNSDRRDAFDRSIRAKERAVADLVDQLGLEEFHVVGHDIGGELVALEDAGHRVTEDRPDAYRDRLEGVLTG